MIGGRTRIIPPAPRKTSSAFAQQFVDAALQLALFRFALAQPLIEIGFWKSRRVGERHADEIVTEPDHLGQERASLARDGQRQLLPGKPGGFSEFDAGAFFRD